jgi:hypothetical protein
MKKALYTAFGQTKSVPLRVYVDAKLVDSEIYDKTLWIERPEDWYAFASMRGVKVRVIERDVWLKSKPCNTGEEQ